MLFVFCSNKIVSTVIHEVWILGKAAWNHWNFSLRFVRIIVLILSVIQQKINFRNINYKREDDFLLSAVILQTIFFFPNPSEKQIQHPCQGGLKKENCTISHQIEKVLYKSSIGIFTTCFHSLSLSLDQTHKIQPEQKNTELSTLHYKDDNVQWPDRSAVTDDRELIMHHQLWESAVLINSRNGSYDAIFNICIFVLGNLFQKNPQEIDANLLWISIILLWKRTSIIQ